ncbi:MAG: alpha-E domain-containing protein [Hymenobacter sp.]
MLSRIAESLFWVGRYVERAEDTARILDVHVHRILEDPCGRRGRRLPRPAGRDGRDGARAPPRQRRPCSSCLGLRRHQSPARSSARCSAARENARGAREAHLLGDVGVPQRHLQRPAGAASARPHGSAPTPFFAYVKERAAILAGLADSTMSRDDGWRFLVLGRSLERVDMTARLLSAGFGDAVGVAGVGHHAAVLLGPRGLPAHLPAAASTPAWWPSSCCSTGSSPASVFHALAEAERVPGRARPARRPGRASRTRPAASSAGPAPTWSSAGSTSSSPTSPSHLRALQASCADGRRRGGPSLLPPERAQEWNSKLAGGRQ